MPYVYKTETHESGFSFRIVLDDGRTMDSPISGDESVAFFVFHRRLSNPAESLARDPESLAQWEADNADEWESFPLFLYDHSGQCYRPSRGGNPFSCPWDSGRVGSIALKRKDFIGNADKGDATRADLFKTAESFCAEYTSLANGEVYGFEVLDPSGNVLDSCWGFIGAPDESGIIDEARAAMESAIADHIPAPDDSDVSERARIEAGVALARDIVAAWESGDLARAVNALEEWADDCVAAGYEDSDDDDDDERESA